MNKPDVLIINSYAGSLTIAATQAKFDIRGSYEDAGYGLKVQRENFPKLDYRERREDWPKQDLSNTIVIAHPPCSGFSRMTPRSKAGGGANWKDHVGLTSSAFACTRSVVEYAMTNRAVAVLVESVTPALEGARAVHEELAGKRYDLFRVLQCASTFGVPQRRRRFWAVFTRKGALEGPLVLDHRPRPAAVHDVVTLDGEAFERDQVNVDKQWEILERELGRPFARWAFKEGRGKLPDLIYHYLKDRGELGKVGAAKTKTQVLEAGTRGAIAKSLCVGGPLFINCLRFLDPNGLTPTLLGSSFWAVDGRAVNRDEYKLIMGFPLSYKFPKMHSGQYREYLSKGVCPPVAKWLLEEVARNLVGKAGKGTEVAPGGTLDLIPAKKVAA